MLKYSGKKKNKKKKSAVLPSLTQTIKPRLLLFFHLDGAPRSPARFRYITEGTDENVLLVKHHFFHGKRIETGSFPSVSSCQDVTGRSTPRRSAKATVDPGGGQRWRTESHWCRHGDAVSYPRPQTHTNEEHVRCVQLIMNQNDFFYMNACCLFCLIRIMWAGCCGEHFFLLEIGGDESSAVLDSFSFLYLKRVMELI